MTIKNSRVYAQGVEVTKDGISFRVWAPERQRVRAVFPGRADSLSLVREDDGHWSAMTDQVAAGDLYSYRLDDEERDYPDPAARFFPHGPHGPAQIVDPLAFAWTDASWSGVPPRDHVLYEMHLGTFSPDGTWSGAEEKLPLIKELGITTLEVMPVAAFDGRFGWGYDGVGWFAPTHLYGTPDDLRHFVDRAHALGLAVILDVVYNHFGPSGNYTSAFSRFYAGAAATEWGAGLNYDGENAHGMRSLAIDNAGYWIAEFHFDGLRLDATQAITDGSREHIISAITRSAKAAAGRRHLFLVGESEPQDARLLRDRTKPAVGSGLTALWNDDFHHSARVALTGKRQAYFSDYRGHAGEWLAALRTAFIYQGQRSRWQSKSRGRPTHRQPMRSFVCFLENHDQVANSLWNLRLWQQCMPAQHRAMTAFLLLGPWTPMLFQGQEWDSTAPFRYFAGFTGDLASLVRRGRADFLSQFPGCAKHPEILRDPSDAASFEESRLRWPERDVPEHARALKLHRDLLHIRRQDPTLGDAAPETVRMEAAVLSRRCVLLRYYFDDASETSEGNDRIFLMNLDEDFEIDRVSEPLLAPPIESGWDGWQMLWYSEDPAYGGHGCAEPCDARGGWLIPGPAAVLLAPSRSEPAGKQPDGAQPRKQSSHG